MKNSLIRRVILNPFPSSPALCFPSSLIFPHSYLGCFPLSQDRFRRRNWWGGAPVRDCTREMAGRRVKHSPPTTQFCPTDTPSTTAVDHDSSPEWEHHVCLATCSSTLGLILIQNVMTFWSNPGEENGWKRPGAAQIQFSALRQDPSLLQTSLPTPAD